MSEVRIEVEDINSEDARSLINELSDTLKNITGNDGRSSFNNDDIKSDRSAFVVARDSKGKALGCGALRYFNQDTAEIKRMYVREKAQGIGSKLLKFLEDKASELNYSKVILETRVVNRGAVIFYRKNKYGRAKNYGKYVGRDEAICFEKKL